MARVLVVEDDLLQLTVRCQLLELAGHEVLRAASAAEALQALVEHHPDVLLMDLCLPGVEDGLALLRAGAKQASPPRIVILSGWPEEIYERPEAALTAEILVKPVPARVLLQVLGK